MPPTDAPEPNSAAPGGGPVGDGGQAAPAPGSAPPPPEAESGNKTAAGPTPTSPPEAASGADEDAVYDAFSHLLTATPEKGVKETPSPRTHTADAAKPAAEAHDGETPDGLSGEQSAADAAGETSGGITDADKRLMSRLHMTPRMIEGWSPQQQRVFLDNAAKREQDQQTSYNALRDELNKVRQGDPASQPASQPASETAGQNAPAPPTDDSDGQPDAETSGSSGAFATRAKQAADQIVADYGDEFEPMGQVMVGLGQTVDTLAGRLETSQQENRLLVSFMAEQAIDAGLRDLKADYPSLDAPDARKAVVDRFWSSWHDPQRKREGSILTQLRSTLHSATKAEFGDLTEASAQVKLANTAKERLASQPTPGRAKGRQRPMSDDEIYDQEAARLLGS